MCLSSFSSPLHCLHSNLDNAFPHLPPNFSFKFQKHSLHVIRCLYRPSCLCSLPWRLEGIQRRRLVNTLRRFPHLFSGKSQPDWEFGRPPRRGTEAAREHFHRYADRHCMMYSHRSPAEVIARLKLMFRYNALKVCCAGCLDDGVRVRKGVCTAKKGGLLHSRYLR